MTDLIHRLEAAEGPNRELDGEIWCAANGLEFHSWDGAGVVWLKNGSIRHQPSDKVKKFSASLDAAVSLVPEGWQWWIRHNISGKYTERPGSWYMGQISEYMGKWRFEGISYATPALALCIAALKAREIG